MSKMFVGVLVTVSLIALGAIQMSPLPQEQWSQRKIEKTPRQKEHGKLFKHGGRSLLELAGEQTGDITVVADPPLRLDPAASSTPEPIHQLLQRAVCNVDAVIVGTLTDETAQFNEDNTFIFTDYGMQVEEVIKDNGKKPIQANSNINVTRDGGTLKIDGRTFRAALADFKPFAREQRFLFFLRYLPATNSYLAYADGSFKLQENYVFPYGGRARKEISDDAATFLNNVHEMAKSNCEK
jgi:hypothetical protein